MTQKYTLKIIKAVCSCTLKAIFNHTSQKERHKTDLAQKARKMVFFFFYYKTPMQDVIEGEKKIRKLMNKIIHNFRAWSLIVMSLTH
jgi:hypothetical protein